MLLRLTAACLLLLQLLLRLHRREGLYKCHLLLPLLPLRLLRFALLRLLPLVHFRQRIHKHRLLLLCLLLQHAISLLCQRRHKFRLGGPRSCRLGGLRRHCRRALRALRLALLLLHPLLDRLQRLQGREGRERGIGRPAS